jgi:hypothetical protein
VVAPADSSRAEAALAAAPRSYPGGVAIRIERVEPDSPGEGEPHAPAPALPRAQALRSPATHA